MNRPTLYALVAALALAAFALVAFAPLPAAWGDQQEGIARIGSTLTGVRPVSIGGQDPSGQAQFVQLDANKLLKVQFGLNPETEHPTPSGKKTSNGATAVAIAAAGTGSQRVYMCWAEFRNVSSTVFHTVDLISSGGTVLLEFDLAASSGAGTPGGNIIIDNPGQYQSALGEGLSFKFVDGTGSAGDVTMTSGTFTK